MQTLKTNTTTLPAYDLADWQSGYRSQPTEFSYWIEDIEGEIPADLTGTLFRNGPGLLDVQGQPVNHPFDGDGLISAITLTQGRAHYRSRFVQTTGYVAEQQAGKPLYRGVFGTQKPGGWLANAFDLRLKNIANTNVIYWGDKLLALWEAAEPHRLNPQTLETLGIDYLDGVLQVGDAFSAHPRIDPGNPPKGGGDEARCRSPRLVSFSVKAGLSSKITLFEFDPQGRLVHRYSHVIPGFAFLHDFAITPNYCIFFQNPVSFNPLPYILGTQGAAECIQFNPRQATRALLIPRDGKGPVKVIEIPACFVFHHGNAFETDQEIIVDSICYAEFPTLAGAKSYAEVEFDKIPPGQLWRFKLDLAQGRATAERLCDRSCEFPHLHPQFVGQAYRYLYLAAAHAPQGNAPLQALLKRDLHTGAEQLWSFAPRGFMGEPLFVPHPQATAEDHGWVLVLIYNAERQCSELAIFDAQTITQGPRARLKLHHHVPYGLHGSFTDKCWPIAPLS